LFENAYHFNLLDIRWLCLGECRTSLQETLVPQETPRRSPRLPIAATQPNPMFYDDYANSRSFSYQNGQQSGKEAISAPNVKSLASARFRVNSRRVFGIEI
jgi:hypothetical protein